MLDRFCHAVSKAELVVVALIAPLLLFPTPARIVIPAALIPAVWACCRRATGRFVPSTPINACLSLLLVMVAVSIYATFDVGFSLGKIAGVVLGIAVFWAVCRWTVSEYRFGLLAALFVASGAALAVIGLLGTNWIAKFPLVDPILARLPRAIRGLPGAEEGFQPNPVAGCLVLFLPLQCAVMSSRLRRQLLPGVAPAVSATLATLAAAITAGTFLLTQSRGAFAGLLIAVLAFCAWHSRRTRWVTYGAAAVLVLAAVTLGVRRLMDLAISASGTGMASDVEGRLELWSRALYAIRDFPVTGVGMNGFRKVMPLLYPTFLSPADVDVAHAHNHLLQAALDVGIPGLIAYLAIWLVIAALLVRTYRSARAAHHRAIASAIGVGLLAHFAFSMTDAIPLGAKVGVLFWLTLAAAVSLHQVAFSNADQSANPACAASL